MSATNGHLEGVGLVKRFGGLTALDGVSVETRSGTITALIGPNGAGKTTLFQCLTGVERPDEGRVRLDGRDITTRSPDARARLGISRTFQRLAVFGTMSVEDNLLVGAEHRTNAGVVRRVGGLLAGLIGITVGDQAAHRRRVDGVIDILGLDAVRRAPAATLSTGTLRLVELGRALCHDPEVLLLDEPATGLDTAEIDNFQRVLRDVASRDVAVLLVEHDVDLVFGIADRIYAMAAGQLIAEGTPEEIRASSAVREAYLDIEPAAG
ncbi:MAG TPA: ABC transporter ATP-binding protein [Mycobacteriales bacterium]|nr:ABC transporter ATP-binding protein [Mycobacteriales bacterium]